MSNTAIVRQSVNFYGDPLSVVQQDEVTYTPVKPICDVLGIDWEPQRERIHSDEVLSEVAQVITLQTEGDARAYPLLCIPLEYLNGWLFGVSVKHIRADRKEKLIRYKHECYRVLSQAFSSRPLAPAIDNDRLTALEQRMATIEQGLTHTIRRPVLIADARRVQPMCQTYKDIIGALEALGGRAQVCQIRTALPRVLPGTIRVNLSRMRRQGLLQHETYGIYELVA